MTQNKKPISFTGWVPLIQMQSTPTLSSSDEKKNQNLLCSGLEMHEKLEYLPPGQRQQQSFFGKTALKQATRDAPSY